MNLPNCRTVATPIMSDWRKMSRTSQTEVLIFECLYFHCWLRRNYKGTEFCKATLLTSLYEGATYGELWANCGSLAWPCCESI